jgi:hypothetical protein
MIVTQSKLASRVVRSGAWKRLETSRFQPEIVPFPRVQRSRRGSRPHSRWKRAATCSRLAPGEAFPKASPGWRRCGRQIASPKMTRVTGPPVPRKATPPSATITMTARVQYPVYRVGKQACTNKASAPMLSRIRQTLSPIYVAILSIWLLILDASGNYRRSGRGRQRFKDSFRKRMVCVQALVDELRRLNPEGDSCRSAACDSGACAPASLSPPLPPTAAA